MAIKLTDEDVIISKTIRVSKKTIQNIDEAVKNIQTLSRNSDTKKAISANILINKMLDYASANATFDLYGKEYSFEELVKGIEKNNDTDTPLIESSNDTVQNTQTFGIHSYKTK